MKPSYVPTNEKEWLDPEDPDIWAAYSAAGENFEVLEKRYTKRNAWELAASLRSGIAGLNRYRGWEHEVEMLTDVLFHLIDVIVGDVGQYEYRNFHPDRSVWFPDMKSKLNEVADEMWKRDRYRLEVEKGRAV